MIFPQLCFKRFFKSPINLWNLLTCLIEIHTLISFSCVILFLLKSYSFLCWIDVNRNHASPRRFKRNKIPSPFWLGLINIKPHISWIHFNDLFDTNKPIKILNTDRLFDKAQIMHHLIGNGQKLFVLTLVFFSLLLVAHTLCYNFVDKNFQIWELLLQWTMPQGIKIM